MEYFVENVVAYLDAHALPAAHVFGYSMGGYVALLMAQTHPSRVLSAQTLGTKLAWAPEIAARETRLLDPTTIRAKVPPFAQELAARHTALGWEAVLAHTAELLTDLSQTPRLTPEGFGHIHCPVRLGVGDRDATVTVEETLAVYRALPNAQLAVWPNTPHPLDKIDPAQLAQMIGW
jgi:pimeloyl-ACP methyl ester carboxylesterase